MAEKSTKSVFKKSASKPKKDKMVEVTIFDASKALEPSGEVLNRTVQIIQPERTAKVVFDNDYCRIVEDYDKAEECVFYTLTDKSVPNEAHRFSTMGEAERYAGQRRLK